MSKLALIMELRIRSTYENELKRFFVRELLGPKGFGMQASDSRDIAHALTGTKHAVVRHLRPDCAKCVQDVFADVAEAFLIECKLRTLQFMYSAKNAAWSSLTCTELVLTVAERYAMALKFWRR